jgi:NAD+ diphosphatase
MSFKLENGAVFVRAALLNATEKGDDETLPGDAALVFSGHDVLWGSGDRPYLLPRAAWPLGAEPTLLGKHRGLGRLFALDVEAKDLALSDAELHGAPHWATVRSVLSSADSDWLAVAGLGSAMAAWARANRFCGACGAATQAVLLGEKRQCTGATCGRRAYPRTDPVVIVAIVDEAEGKLLLGRGTRFPRGFFSCVAGFVEPCESLEDAVRREVLEETGLVVSALTFAASQPWPIGRALSCEIMVGFRAVAAPGTSNDAAALSLQAEELAEAKWVTRDECRRAAAASIASPRGTAAEDLDWHCPGPYAIAHHLIAAFANEDATSAPV